MGKYLKQNDVNAAPKRQREKSKDGDTHVVVTGPDSPSHMPTPSLQHDINYVSGMGGIEESLDWIARGIEKLTSDEHSISLSAQYPIRLTLAANDEEDTLDRLVAAVERIADSLARLAGLSRPRLERWYEQDEYTPRYRDIAADGGAPGPAQPGVGVKS